MRSNEGFQHASHSHLATTNQRSAIGYLGTAALHEANNSRPDYNDCNGYLCEREWHAYVEYIIGRTNKAFTTAASTED
jgi:hypothetical protein